MDVAVCYCRRRVLVVRNVIVVCNETEAANGSEMPGEGVRSAKDICDTMLWGKLGHGMATLSTYHTLSAAGRGNYSTCRPQTERGQPHTSTTDFESKSPRLTGHPLVITIVVRLMEETGPSGGCGQMTRIFELRRERGISPQPLSNR
jgi:hypothetical protein